MASTDDNRRKKTVCLDFDGVLHGYSRGWHDGTIYDPPCEGAVEAVQRLAEQYNLVISTCREDVAGIHDWVREHFRLFIPVTNAKPVASLYVDDRGLRHINWADTLDQVERHLSSAISAKEGPGHASTA